MDMARETNLTEIVFILDRSGSMGGLESDTIGGFNSMLTQQQAEPGEARITTVLFDHEYEILHDRLDIRAVNPITSKDYFVRGNTALLDAVGKTIHKIGNTQRHSRPEFRANKVIFVITTDGLENASREYTYNRVKSQITRHKSKYGWEFIFLGADIDSAEFAGRFGIARNRAQNFIKDPEGIHLNYQVVNKAVASFRSPANSCLDDGWNVEIEANYQRRKNQS
ncbi:MAG: VWA domain-containing protein [Synergistaceae bacterium]|nr:VWA domain-containing protein [Synergistaceae bacterium]